MLLTNSLSLTLNYDAQLAQLAQDYTSHNLTALLRLAWQAMKRPNGVVLLSHYEIPKGNLMKDGQQKALCMKGIIL